MSYSLVRASLDLVDCDVNVNRDNKKKKKKRLDGALNLIPVHQRILQKGKIQSQTKKNNSNYSKKLMKSSTDSVQENVQRLLLLSSSKLDSETADELFDRAVKKRAEIPKSKKKVEETTAFTEEDFKKFEVEYIDQ